MGVEWDMARNYREVEKEAEEDGMKEWKQEMQKQIEGRQRYKYRNRERERKR